MNQAHKPVHRFVPQSCLIVTASTLYREHHFNSPARLDFVQRAMLERLEMFEFEPLAWSIFSNHYHLVIEHFGTQEDALAKLIQRLHGVISYEMNKADGVSGRKVMHQYWDTTLTDESARLSRMNYVMHNPVRLGLVSVANQYPWCSESWFLAKHGSARYATVKSFGVDIVNVQDDFEPLLIG